MLSYNTDRNHGPRPGRPKQTRTDHRSPPQHKAQPLPRGVLPIKSALDLNELKEMDTIRLVERLNVSMASFKFFLRSQEEQHNSDEFVFELTCILANACSAPPGESTNNILAALKGSLFFSSKIPRLLDRVQAQTALTGQEPRAQRRLTECLIKIFMRYLRHLPSSYADLPYPQLKQSLDQSKIDGKDDLQRELEAFKQTRDDIILAERQKHGRRYVNRIGQKPPNDFRDMPICPTNEEVKSQERPFLRKNILKGRYEDAEHYLDVQFRLLREDFLEPLREGIHEIVQNVPRKQRNQLMKYYPGARIVEKKFTRSGIIYQVQFDVSRFNTSRWANSKRLMFGSFLCLSNNNFETMLFATVCFRDPEELTKGKICIRFIEEQDVFGIENRNCEYQMVESPAYYEAYHHVLKGLKELDETTMPFRKYLVECSEDVDPPEYLRREDSQEPVCYDLSLALDVPDATNARRVPVLQPGAWPSVETLPLNSSQLEALQTAVTSEFCVIQGPPGTGKTYVGAKIVRCLLENREAWDPEGFSPMLMVCYTNHALDQFLEKVLEFLPQEDIIRVGGRCKSQKLEACNLKLFTDEYRMHGRRREVRDMIRNKVSELKGWKDLLVKADKKLLEFEDLEELLNSEHAEQLCSANFPPNVANECRTASNTFKLWLCNNKLVSSLNQSTKAKRDQEENHQDGPVFLANDAGGEHEVFHDISIFSPRSTTAGNSTKNQYGSLEGENAESLFPSLEVDAPNLANETHQERKKEFSLQQKRRTENSLGITSSASFTSLSGQQSCELESSVLSPASFDGCNVNATLSKTPGDKEHVGSINHKDDPRKVKDASSERENEETVALEEAITIENEADLIQYQRCMHGDEDLFCDLSKQSDELITQKQEQEEIIKNQEYGWETVSYKKKKPPRFSWLDKPIKNFKAKVQENGDTQAKFSKKSVKNNKSNKIQIYAEITYLKRELENKVMMTANEVTAVHNIWILSPSDRLRLYLFWVESYRERYRVEIQRGEQEYEQLCQDQEAIRFEEEEEVIRRATVVGMTTSCAARYHSTLQRVAPRVVVIEEAAEVMEAHIITSLSHDTKHTILIGDHKQLRPKATVYELAKKYNLEISLFERMVMNSMDCKRLCIQHRMRPEIAALTKRIYDHEIIDHETVCTFEEITGLSHNVFFIDHRELEVQVEGLQSYSNPHEADFLVALCNYLLHQGYSGSQITVLTMYTGQLLLLQEKMPRRTYGGVRVCAVDNFQGEESDIILLSLVRSNDDGKIGFLNESNRICVALSRARQGFYCIGNFALLKSQCKLWQEICAHLETKSTIGDTLQLVCKKHNNVTDVRTSREFNTFGGCKMSCGDRLVCGHACERPCHVSDQFHQKGWCTKLCLMKCCPSEHECQWQCHYPRSCPECRHPVLKTVPQCGHEQLVPCSIDPEKFSCRVKCEKILACRHNCQEECGKLCTRQCTVDCKKTLPCGHEKSMPCFKVSAICNRKCTKVLECGHPCSKTCKQHCECNTQVDVELACGHRKRVLCREKDRPPQCVEKCKRALKCGHDCPGICHEDCEMKTCKSEVIKFLPCGHQQSVACHLDPQKAFCYAPCQRQLDCGHKCSSICGRACQEVRCQEWCQKKCERDHACQRKCHSGSTCGDCMIVVNMTIPTCGHSVEMPCHIDPSTIRCKKPCERFRICGHRCQNTCSKNCEARACKELINTTLPCGHVVVLACHKDPEKFKCEETVEVFLSCGHKNALACHVAKASVQNVLCNVKVEKELPCKHKLTLPCHKSPEDCKCKKKVDVRLPCGHGKSLICSTMPADLQNVSCVVKMKRKLPCEHEATIPCYRNPMEHVCEEEAEITLPCGHKKITACSNVRNADLQNVACMVKMKRKLPCEHEATIPCYINPMEHVCEEEAEITLPCGHNKVTTCSNVRNGQHEEICDTKVTRRLHCGHEKEMICSDNPGEVFCDDPCERRLSCEHPCPKKCGDDCASVKCAVTVQKVLTCGYHEISCRCSDDVSQIICRSKCNRKFSCGHTCPGKCSENCSQYKCEKLVFKPLDCAGKHSRKMPCSDDPKDVACQERCKNNLDCGHPCPGICSEKCASMKCMRRIEKLFPCGHKQPLQCFKSKVATCKEPCRRPKSSCKHICKGVCGQDCSKYPCDVVIVKPLPCGHKVKMLCSQSTDDVQCPAACAEKLPCGHQCSGTCEDCQQRGSHELCQRPCGRLLVCSHRCKAICSEPCPPCDRKCGRRCPHGKCMKRCFQMCEPCNKPCTWSCPHYQCNNLCEEECDRPRCNAPCPKKLPCRHPCIGLCGENCPTVCAVCQPNKVLSMLADGRGNKTEPSRCIQLIDCGHIVNVEEMDNWMLRKLGNDVQLMRCPKCSTPISFSHRYGNIIKRTLKGIENVKTQIEELENGVTDSVRLIGNDLQQLKYYVKTKQRFLQRELRVEQLISWTWNPFRWRPRGEHSVLFMFTFKNHLMILRQIQRTDQVLHVCRFPPSLHKQSELKELWNNTKDALEKIKEYLEEPELDLKTLSQVYEQTEKFLLFSHVLEAQSKTVISQIPFSSLGATRLNLACERFRMFLQGNDDALDLEWLRKLVNLLRVEVNLPLLPSEEAKEFANFPGYQQGVWKSCDQGHIYFTGWILRGGEDIPVGTEGCTRCTADG